MTTKPYLSLYRFGNGEIRSFSDFIEVVNISDLIEVVGADQSSPFLSFIALLPAVATRNDVERVDNSIRIPNSSLETMFNSEDDPLKNSAELCGYKLVVESKGTIAFPDFELRYFFEGDRGKVAVRPVGLFARHQEKCLRLFPKQSAAIALIEEFNSFEKNTAAARAMEYVDRLQKLQEEGRVGLSKYLNSESYLLADSISLKASDQDGILNVAPSIPGLSGDELAKAFHYFSDVQQSYNLNVNGKITRVIVPNSTRSIFEAIKKHGRVLSGEQRKKVLKNPYTLFGADPEINQDLVSIEDWGEKVGHLVTDSVVLSFGPRVIGFSEDYRQARAVAPSSAIDWFAGFDMEAGTLPEPTITVSTVDGGQITIPLKNKEQITKFEKAVFEAKKNSQDSFLFDGLTIPMSSQLLQAVRTVAVELAPRLEEKKKKLVLDVIENIETVDFEASRNTILDSNPERAYSPPKSLKGLELKEHQVTGIKWLLRKFKDGSPGVVMADDMGLGKTIQLLAFAAHCIEEKLIPELTDDKPPYHPILIVCPKILFDGWLENHIVKYFHHLFTPFIKLHGTDLKRVLKTDTNKNDPFEVKLKLDEICQNRIVLTNYDTLANYQMSLALIDWSIIIFDEAQKIKEPSTSASKAAKAIKGRFKIASTGTPVENHLGNIFSLFNTVYPGPLLGSAKEFREFYNVSPEIPRDEQIEKLDSLRQRIGVNEPSGYLIRRNKEDGLQGLPTKTREVHFCDLSEEQEKIYDSVVAEVKSQQDTKKGGVLEGLNRLQQICEHPFLLQDYPFRKNSQEYLTSCPKLDGAINLLREIKQKSEKVLVFARYLKIQTILQQTFCEVLGVECDILNGTTTKQAEKIIKKFSDSKGFGVLILSPDVAGVGLTITAANHVIHYGRWWNPAQENQATDRVYRIGQEKPVFVHYFVSQFRNRKGTKTFDENLHEVITQKNNLARDFLTPRPGEGSCKKQLTKEVFGIEDNTPDVESGETEQISSNEGINIKALDPDQFEALLAAIFQKKGYQVFLTPFSGDKGIDVIAFNEKEVVLIQCKHTKSGLIEQFGSAISELQNGLTAYRNEIAPELFSGRVVKLIYATNKNLEDHILNRAAKSEVEILNGFQLVQLISDLGVSSIHISEAKAQRLSSLDKLKSILSDKYKRAG